MFDDVGSSLTQNCIDVWLVQNDVYFKKPIWGSDLQPLPPPTQRSASFDSEDLPASTLHHMAIFALCLG